MKIQVCNGRNCSACGSEYIFKRLNSDVVLQKPMLVPEIEFSQCQGNCREAPCMRVDEQQFTRLNPVIASKKLIELLKKTGKSEK